MIQTDVVISTESSYDICVRDIVLYRQSSEPDHPACGDLWYNTSNTSVLGTERRTIAIGDNLSGKKVYFDTNVTIEDSSNVDVIRASSSGQKFGIANVSGSGKCYRFNDGTYGYPCYVFSTGVWVKSSYTVPAGFGTVTYVNAINPFYALTTADFNITIKPHTTYRYTGKTWVEVSSNDGFYTLTIPTEFPEHSITISGLRSRYDIYGADLVPIVMTLRTNADMIPYLVLIDENQAKANTMALESSLKGFSNAMAFTVSSHDIQLAMSSENALLSIVAECIGNTMRIDSSLDLSAITETVTYIGISERCSFYLETYSNGSIKDIVYLSSIERSVTKIDDFLLSDIDGNALPYLDMIDNKSRLISSDVSVSKTMALATDNNDITLESDIDTMLLTETVELSYASNRYIKVGDSLSGKTLAFNTDVTNISADGTTGWLIKCDNVSDYGLYSDYNTGTHISRLYVYANGSRTLIYNSNQTPQWRLSELALSSLFRNVSYINTDSPFYTLIKSVFTDYNNIEFLLSSGQAEVDKEIILRKLYNRIEIMAPEYRELNIGKSVAVAADQNTLCLEDGDDFEYWLTTYDGGNLKDIDEEELTVLDKSTGSLEVMSCIEIQSSITMRSSAELDVD